MRNVAALAGIGPSTSWRVAGQLTICRARRVFKQSISAPVRQHATAVDTMVAVTLWSLEAVLVHGLLHSHPIFVILRVGMMTGGGTTDALGLRSVPGRHGLLRSCITRSSRRRHGLRKGHARGGDRGKRRSTHSMRGMGVAAHLAVRSAMGQR
ncbi:unnamed protein product [Urochloa humidicola]